MPLLAPREVVIGILFCRFSKSSLCSAIFKIINKTLLADFSLIVYHLSKAKLSQGGWAGIKKKSQILFHQSQDNQNLYKSFIFLDLEGDRERNLFIIRFSKIYNGYADRYAAPSNGL